MLPKEKDEIAPGDTPKPNKLEPAQWTWFFQRPNGEIFACHAVEAYHLLRKTSEYQRHLKLVGSSDGSVFAQAVQDSHRVFRETNDVEQAKALIRKGEADEIERARGNMKLPPDPSRVQYSKT
jgi:hypothetical protein